MPRTARAGVGNICDHVINRGQNQADIDRLGVCVNRERPFGSKHWISRIAKTLGLEFTLRPRGCPKKQV